MQRSSPLRWFAAIGIMFLVMVIAFLLLIRTMSQTIRLSSGASENPTAGLEDASAQPSEPGSGEGAPSGDFPQNYTVADGDTGDSISERFYGNPDGWSAIAEANDIDPSAPLRVGAKLKIPPPPE